MVIGLASLSLIVNVGAFQHSNPSLSTRFRRHYTHKLFSDCIQVHNSNNNLYSKSSCLKATVEIPPATDTDADADADAISNKISHQPAFTTLSQLGLTALYRSDLKRDAKGTKKATGSSATNWIDDRSSFALKNLLDKITITSPANIFGLERDEAIAWMRWMKASPVPLIVDLTTELLHYGNTTGTIGSAQLEQMDTKIADFNQRISCRLILLPSGAELKHPLVEPTGAIVFGKLLYGGVSRFRVLGSSTSNRPPRRVGENTAIKSSAGEDVPSWIQFGGSDRKYEAVDMGASAILELTLMPQGKKVVGVLENQKQKQKGDDMDGDGDGNSDDISSRSGGEMGLNRLSYDASKLFAYSDNIDDGNSNGIGNDKDDEVLSGNSAMNLGGIKRNEAFTNDFQRKVGGLDDQIEVIVRRVLDGRVIRPVEEDSADTNDGNDYNNDDVIGMTDGQLSQAALEADELALLGLTPVRGLLLYGPPGCGKTALAREISIALRARSPKIVAAPELLDRWVGSSEKLIRCLFADAEAELASCNDDATKSALHVIVIDEIDAVFRRRSSAEDSGEATRSSAVNQILAKLDGVKSIPNVLLIGMTNRRELLDEALLRPGRLEVQILVPKPDVEGRRDILNIHFEALRKKGRLSKPLCCAIDGVKYEGGSDKDEEDALLQTQNQAWSKSKQQSSRKRDKLKKMAKQLVPSVSSRNFDLAGAATNGYSGADLAGLVRCAGSMALARTRNAGSGIEELLITLDDVKNALNEVAI